MVYDEIFVIGPVVGRQLGALVHTALGTGRGKRQRRPACYL